MVPEALLAAFSGPASTCQWLPVAVSGQQWPTVGISGRLVGGGRWYVPSTLGSSRRQKGSLTQVSSRLSLGPFQPFDLFLFFLRFIPPLFQQFLSRRDPTQRSTYWPQRGGSPTSIPSSTRSSTSLSAQLLPLFPRHLANQLSGPDPRPRCTHPAR